MRTDLVCVQVTLHFQNLFGEFQEAPEMDQIQKFSGEALSPDPPRFLAGGWPFLCTKSLRLFSFPFLCFTRFTGWHYAI